VERSEQEQRFGEWLGKHRPMLHKVVNTFANDADRDDLMQEMLLSLWKAFPSFRGESRESSFAYRVVHNCALTWIRSQSRRRDRESRAFEEQTLRTDNSATTNTRLELLYECIRELPAVDRSIITMSLDGLSHGEIGDVVGSKENAISVRIHRIRKQLTKSFERKGNEHEH